MHYLLFVATHTLLRISFDITRAKKTILCFDLGLRVQVGRASNCIRTRGRTQTVSVCVYVCMCCICLSLFSLSHSITLFISLHLSSLPLHLCPISLFSSFSSLLIFLDSFFLLSLFLVPSHVLV